MMMSICVPAGKNDDVGHAQPYGRTGLALCAVCTTRAWLAAMADRGALGPLFWDAHGNPLTYKQWYNITRRSLKLSGMFTDHYETRSIAAGERWRSTMCAATSRRWRRSEARATPEPQRGSTRIYQRHNWVRTPD
jgi:hypothetical protein